MTAGVADVATAHSITVRDLKVAGGAESVTYGSVTVETHRLIAFLFGTRSNEHCFTIVSMSLVIAWLLFLLSNS